MDQNEYELSLLNNDPGQLILRYQRAIEVIVQMYINTGLIQEGQRADMIQYINQQLLEKIGRIREQYNGCARLTTYLSAIIRNLCLQKVRNEGKQPENVVLDNLENYVSGEVSQLDRLVIRQELYRLDRLLELYHIHRGKVELILKAVFRLPVKPEDFLRYCADFPFDELAREVRYFMTQQVSTEKETYRHLTSVVNRCEDKKTNIDNVRKWAMSRIGELIKHLNSEAAGRGYDQETLQILAEKYFVEIGNNRPADEGQASSYTGAAKGKRLIMRKNNDL